MYNVSDRMNVALGAKMLRQSGEVGGLLAKEDTRDKLPKTMVIVVVADDLSILVAIFDGFLDGGFDGTLYCTMRFDKRAVGALLLLFGCNHFGRPFMATTLYLHMQLAFENVCINV